jgi:hypothetical protein
LSFQGFEAIDVTLSLFIAPTFTNGISDSGKVVPNDMSESSQSVQA